jgi:hypothetical protein
MLDSAGELPLHRSNWVFEHLNSWDPSAAWKDQLALGWVVLVFRKVEASVQHQDDVTAGSKMAKREVERTSAKQRIESISNVEWGETAVPMFPPPSLKGEPDLCEGEGEA